MDIFENMDETIQRRFAKAVQATIQSAATAGDLAIVTSEPASFEKGERPNLAATQELDLTEVDW